MLESAQEDLREGWEFYERNAAGSASGQVAFTLLECVVGPAFMRRVLGISHIPLSAVRGSGNAAATHRRQQSFGHFPYPAHECRADYRLQRKRP